MEKLLRVVFGVSKALNDFAGVALTFMVATTVIDVCFRAIGHPFLGAYEIVGPICGPLVIGFALPLSSWNRNHISIDIFLPKKEQMIRITATSTRIVCMLLFGFIGYNLFSLGTEFRTSAEVTQTIHLPFFWVTYGLGICCFFECIVFICDIIKIWRVNI